MGYQFIHIESYARSAGKSKAGGHSISSIIDEASREASSIPHVEHPAAPILLFGCPLNEVEDKANDWAEKSVDACGRKLRKDGLCLLAGVISAPDDMTNEDWQSMKATAIDWLNKDGRLVSVIEHTDEAHKHIHFYKVPAVGERFESIHPGRAASLAIKAQGKVKSLQNQAYKAAMRGYQDEFFNEVALQHKLTRLGPGKRRLTRDEWVNEQKQYASLAESLKTVRQAKFDAQNIIDSAKAISDKAKADSDKLEADRNALSIAKEKVDKKMVVLNVASKKLAKEKNYLISYKKTITDEIAKKERANARINAVADRIGDFVDRIANFIFKGLDHLTGWAAKEKLLKKQHKAAMDLEKQQHDNTLRDLEKLNRQKYISEKKLIEENERLAALLDAATRPKVSQKIHDQSLRRGSGLSL